MDRRTFLESATVLAASSGLPRLAPAKSNYEIAAYYFGNYHEQGIYQNAGAWHTWA